MYLVFKSMDDWFKAAPNIEKKFTDTYSIMLNAAQRFAQKIDNTTKEKTEKPAIIQVSSMRLRQGLVDAFDDLMRLTNYHPTKDPNPIKEMAYLGYWFVMRKPMWLANEDIINSEQLGELTRCRIHFINEAFVARLLVSAMFEGKHMNDCCAHIKELGEKQIQFFEQYLLYTLVYRLESPKSLEATMIGGTIHPIWKVNPIIWSEPLDAASEF